MKPPKEPKTFRHPRLYWADVDGINSEMILIYPDGEAERTSNHEPRTFRHCPLRIFYLPCWHRLGMTAPQAVRAMKRYAKRHGFEREFVGEVR